MNRLCALTLFALLSFGALARSGKRSTRENEVNKTMNVFIQAFDNLDWNSFCGAFTDDATVFYPRAIFDRANGRAEFEHNFRQVFDQIRGSRTKGPYMDLKPRNLKIQLAGDVAIVTFHLDDRPGFVNRRTIILQKLSAGWKIVHLHASEVAIPPR